MKNIQNKVSLNLENFFKKSLRIKKENEFKK